MNSTIDVSVEFSYRGETKAPAATLDLDGILRQYGGLPEIHQLLARQAGIDTYSYEYEVMEVHELGFSNPTGLAAEHFHDGHFDVDGFIRQWQEQELLVQLRPIAREHLGVEQLEERVDLSRALIAAYQAGAASARHG